MFRAWGSRLHITIKPGQGPYAAWLARIFLPLTIAGVVGIAAAGGSALAPLDDPVTQDLRSVFPGASRFEPRGGELPHFRVFKTGANDDQDELLGFAYYTTDIEKLEKGYKAPINFLVGMSLGGQITGIKLIEHDEPYGYFSIETVPFTEQFMHKSILDKFRVGRDIDAISSATITIASASRGIRNSGRRIARQYLAESSGT